MKGSECCASPCRFWRSNGSDDTGGEGYTGQCRRKPPTFSGERYVFEKRNRNLTGLDALNVASVFPVTMADDWCGEFEPNGFQGPC